MTEIIPDTQVDGPSHWQLNPKVEPTAAELVEVLGPIVESAEIHDTNPRVAVLPNRIKNFNSQNHFYANGSIVRLAEIMIRRGSEDIRSARLYLDVQQARNGLPFVPVICIGPRTIVSRLADREGLECRLYDGHIPIDENEDMAVDHDHLTTLRGLRSVVEQSDLGVVQRKASFRLTGISMPLVNGSLCIVKHYDKVVEPDSGEFFAHILSQNETDPLLSGSQIGDIQGLCVTNSQQYELQHPELRFMSITH